MSSWNYGGFSSSNPIEDQLVNTNILDEFSSDDNLKTFHMIIKLFQSLRWSTIQI